MIKLEVIKEIVQKILTIYFLKKVVIDFNFSIYYSYMIFCLISELIDNLVNNQQIKKKNHIDV